MYYNFFNILCSKDVKKRINNVHKVTITMRYTCMFFTASLECSINIVESAKMYKQDIFGQL